MLMFPLDEKEKAMAKAAAKKRQAEMKKKLDLNGDGKITEEEAMRNADSANNMRLKIKLAREGGAGGIGGLSLEATD